MYKHCYLCLAHTVETLASNVCLIQETHTHNRSPVIRLKFTHNSPVKFDLRISEDSTAAASCVSGVDMALSKKAEAVPLGLVPVDSWLLPVRLIN